MITWKLHVLMTHGDYTYPFIEKPEMAEYRKHITWTGKKADGAQIEIRIGLGHVHVLEEIKT